MKQENQTITKIETSETFAPVNMGISDDPEDQKMILNILTNSLYTDKIAAVLREYGCNAADANTEAGKPNKPIKVHIPTREEPFLSIRDEGGGMSEDQILKVFCRLGRSTKRNSNAYTGMLGIGSKAGFAYGDSFLVTSFVNGTRTVYNCFRDKHGLPTMAKMDAGSTTEPDGIEVKLAAKMADIPYFADKANEVFRYFNPMPDGIKIYKPEIVIADKNWRFVGTRGESVAIMGNVGYVIDANAIRVPEKYSSMMQQYGRNCSLEMDFAIGELEIAANREGLQYKEHTKTAICDRLKTVMKDVVALLTKETAAAPSIWQARMIVKKMSYLLNLRNMHLTWRGKHLSQDFNLPDSTDEAMVVTYNHSRWRNRTSKAYRPTIEVNGKFVLVVDDGSKYHKSRIDQYLTAEALKKSTDDYSVTYFKFKTPAIEKTYWSAHDLTGAPVIKLATLPYTAVPRPARALNSKHSKQCFTFNTGAASSYGPRSVYWTPATLDPAGTGVYVPLDRFIIVAMNSYRLSYPELGQQLKTLKAAGLFTGPLYGVKPATVLKLDKGWVQLHEWVAANLTKEAKQALVDYRAVRTHAPLFKDPGYKNFYPDSPADMLAKAVVGMTTLPAKLEPFIKAIVGSNNQVYTEHLIPSTMKLPDPSYDLKELTKDVVNKYPLFGAINLHILHQLPMKPVADYVELIEKSKA